MGIIKSQFIHKNIIRKNHFYTRIKSIQINYHVQLYQYVAGNFFLKNKYIRVAAKEGYKFLKFTELSKKEWVEKGVWPPAPPYHKGQYYNKECQVNQSEYELFEILRFRSDLIITEKAVALAYRLGITLDAEQEENEITQDLWAMIDKQLQPSSRTDIIDLKYQAVYNPKAGFKVCIDGLHGQPSSGIFAAVYCINLPGTLYIDEPDPLQVHVNSALDWDSPKYSPKFSEGYVDFRSVEFAKFKHLVIDFRRVEFKKKKKKEEFQLTPYAWTILPLFTYDSYVNSGIYQIPLVKGAVSRKILKDLTLTNDPWQKFWEMTKTLDEFSKKPILLPLEYCSVVVRLLDGQREGHFQVPYDWR